MIFRDSGVDWEVARSFTLVSRSSLDRRAIGLGDATLEIVCDFSAEVADDRVTWSPYPGVLRVTARSNGQYRSQPDWYRNFAYSEEQARGLDFIEDLAAPGVFEFDLGAGRAELVLAAEGHEALFFQSLDAIIEFETTRSLSIALRLMAMLCGKCYRFSCQAPISEIPRAIWKSGHLRQARCKRVVRAVNGSINLPLSIFEFADEERCHDQ